MVKISFICWGNRTSTFSESDIFYHIQLIKYPWPRAGIELTIFVVIGPICIDRNKCNLYHVILWDQGTYWLRKLVPDILSFLCNYVWGFIARIVIKLFASDFRRYFFLQFSSFKWEAIMSFYFYGDFVYYIENMGCWNLISFLFISNKIQQNTKPFYIDII